MVFPKIHCTVIVGIPCGIHTSTSRDATALHVVRHVDVFGIQDEATVTVIPVVTVIIHITTMIIIVS